MAEHKEYSCIKKTKRALAESLAHIAQSKPLNKITVKEVCEGAQLSRNAFYTHYPDINGLIEEIEKQTLDRVKEILDELVDGEFPHNMLVSVQKLLGLLMQDKETTLMLFDNSNSTSFPEELKEILGTFFFGYFRDFNSAGFEKTYNYFYVFIAEGMIGMLRLWLQQPGSMSKEMFAYMSYVMIRRLMQLNNDSIA